MKKSSLGMLHCLISVQRSPNIMTTQRSHSIIIKRREGGRDLGGVAVLFCGSYKCSILNFVQLFINSFSHFHHIVSSWTELTHEDFSGTIFVFLVYFYKNNTLRPRHHILEPFWITHTLIIWPTQILGPDVLPCAQCQHINFIISYCYQFCPRHSINKCPQWSQAFTVESREGKEKCQFRISKHQKY